MAQTNEKTDTTAKAASAVKAAKAAGTEAIAKTSAKAAGTAKTAAKAAKAAAKTAKDAGKTKAAKAVKETATKAKKAVSAVKKELAATHYFEIDGMQVSTAEITERIKDAHKADGHRVGSIKKLDVYYNFAERRAYYVINEKADGKFVEF